jgi:hypothetical protein
MYSDVAMLAADNDFILRTRAAVAQEGELDPVQWSLDHQWQMAGTPGFGDAYAYAVGMNVPRPGNDPSVITDPQILSAVQFLRTGTTSDAGSDLTR